MVMVCTRKHAAFLGVALLLALFCAPAATFAAEGAVGEVAAEDEGMGEAMRVTGLAMAACIAISAAAFGTAKAQSAVGSGGTGALAEKPEVFTSILILFAIPETIVILGFVVALLLWTKI